MKVAAGKKHISRREVLLAGMTCVPAAAWLVGRGSWRTRSFAAAPANVADGPDGATLIYGADGGVFATNASGLYLWRLLDGRRTGDDLVVTGTVRIKPGVYRVADRNGDGVIHVKGDGTKVDLPAGRHAIRVEHFELDGWAALRVSLAPAGN